MKEGGSRMALGVRKLCYAQGALRGGARRVGAVLRSRPHGLGDGSHTWTSKLV